MNNSNHSEFLCSYCNIDVEEIDEYCHNCGNLFVESIFCTDHPNQEAKGVCIICCAPCCSNCGRMINDRFLCFRHAGCEIYQGMARVFGTSHESLAQYAYKGLECAGLNPFSYANKSNTICLGSSDYTLFCACGDFNGHISNEIKIMVPCPEVVRARSVLKDLALVAKEKDCLEIEVISPEAQEILQGYLLASLIKRMVLPGILLAFLFFFFLKDTRWPSPFIQSNSQDNVPSYINAPVQLPHRVPIYTTHVYEKLFLNIMILSDFIFTLFLLGFGYTRVKFETKSNKIKSLGE